MTYRGFFVLGVQPGLHCWCCAPNEALAVMHRYFMKKCVICLIIYLLD